MSSLRTHMTKRLTLAILLMLILVVSLGAYLYVQKTQSDIQKAANVSSFNFICRYGVGSRNGLDTFNDTYTIDLGWSEPPITANLTLTLEEKWQILQEIAEIDFFSLPSNFTVDPNFYVEPQVDYYIKVQNGTQTKELSWNARSIMEDNAESKLDQLIGCIQRVIEQNPECKALPTPFVGYV